MEKFIGFYTYKPFWSERKPDLELFNSKNYDIPGFYSLMAEIVFKHKEKNIDICVCRDGLIMVSKYFSKRANIEQKWKEYLELLNTIYLLFESSYLKNNTLLHFDISSITYQDAFGLEFENGQFKGQGVPAYSYAEKYVEGRFLSNYDTTDDKYWHHYDRRIKQRIVIGKETFSRLKKDLSKLFSHENPYELISIFSDYTKSLSEYKILNFNTSLVLSWFIIEKFINKYWENFIDSNPAIIDSKRKDCLQDYRTYTIAVKSEILEFNKIITLEQYKKINRLRVKRNAIVHQNSKQVTSEECGLAFDLIKEFIFKFSAIDLKINTSYSVSGI